MITSSRRRSREQDPTSTLNKLTVDVIKETMYYPGRFTAFKEFLKFHKNELSSLIMHLDREALIEVDDDDVS